MSVFHWSTRGPVRGYFSPDIDGYVATTAAEVMKLNWEETPTRDQAKEIASENRMGLRRVSQAGRNFSAGRGFRGLGFLGR